MKNLLKKTLIGLFGFLIISCVFAAAPSVDPPPLIMLKTTASQMTGELNKHLGNLKNNKPLVSSIVKKIVVPRFDLNGMSQLVVGRYWRQASDATKQGFIREFTDYVINTYSNALSSYDGEVIKFYPIRNYSDAQTRVRVNSDIMHKSGSPVNLQYKVAKCNGQWLVYDFSVDGVSLVENYRSQFANSLQKGGLEYLVQKLATHNRNIQR